MIQQDNNWAVCAPGVAGDDLNEMKIGSLSVERKGQQ